MFPASFFCMAVTVVMGFSVTDTRTPPYNPTPSEWPVACSGRTYCDIKPSYYPDNIFRTLLESYPQVNSTVTSEIEDRDGDDVACSENRRRNLRQIYLIKDDNDQIRFVMQTEKVYFRVVVEECRVPGRVEKSEYLDRDMLAQKRVDCVELKIPILLPVLSLDGTILDAISPKGGMPFSCSAKVMKNN